MGNTIDPRIAMGVQVPQIEGPIDLSRGSLSVQQLINATQLQKQQQTANEIHQQQAQIDLQQQQQAQQDTIAFNKAFHDANGDWDTAIKNATSNGVSGTFILQKQIARADQIAKMATANKDLLTNEQTKSDAIAKDAVALQQIKDPEDREAMYQQMVNKHLMSGGYKPTDFSPTAPSDTELQAYINHNKAAQDMIKEAAELRDKNAKLPGEQAKAMAERASSASQMMNGALNQIAWTARRNLVAKNDPEMAQQIPENYSPEAAQQVKELGISPEKALSIPLDRAGYAQWAADPKNAGKSIQDFQNEQELRKQQTLMPGEIRKIGAEASARGAAEVALLNKLNQQSQQGGQTVAPGMTKDTTDQAATTYHNTGQLPSVGRGQAGVAQRTAIMNREREMFPGTVLSADTAEFKANSDSLKKLTGQFNTVDAFEKTASKNIDRLLQTADTIPDLGLRYANIPVRMISGSMIGTENMARFKADLATAQAEATRVLNSANANGGAISDHARKELQDIADGNLPIPALKAAFGELKIDMGNRHDAYSEQIADIQKKLQGGKASGTPFTVPAGAPPAPKEDGHKLKANGQVIAVSKGGSWVAP